MTDELKENLKDRINYFHNEYKNRLTEKQIQWLIDYERRTGFEPICDLDLSFEEVVDQNIIWFEDHCNEQIEKLRDHERMIEEWEESS